MINANRIVPIQNLDTLSLYGTILKLHGVSGIAKLSAVSAGEFSQTTNSATVLCDEPVKTFDFGSAATAGTVYFVAAYDYEGFTLAGAKITTAGETVEPDASTLYTATLSSGTITIAKIGL